MLRVVTKRTFDVAAGSAVLLVTWPLMVLAALAIYLESGFRGPIFTGRCGWAKIGACFS